MPAPRHVFQTFIRATPEAVWQAITDPDFTRRYFHRTAVESSLQAGAPVRYVLPDGTEAVTGEVTEVEPGRRLVMTWRVLYDATLADEPPSTVEWVVTPGADGVTQGDDRPPGPRRSAQRTSSSVGAGWPWILGSMKSLLETAPGAGGRGPGRRCGGRLRDDAEGALHRRLAVDANNATWELLERGRAARPDDVDDLLGAGVRRGLPLAPGGRDRARERGAGGVARVARPRRARTRRRRPAPRRSGAGDVATAAGLADFDLAYAHEARARALACLGRRDEAAAELAAAHAVPDRRRRGPHDPARRPRRRTLVRPPPPDATPA